MKMEKMKTIVFLAIIISSSFLIGRLSVKPMKPKVTTITEILKEKIYDLTQKPEVIETYYNLAGRVSLGKTELDTIKAQEWGKGYNEGYRDAIKRK